MNAPAPLCAWFHVQIHAKTAMWAARVSPPFSRTRSSQVSSAPGQEAEQVGKSSYLRHWIKKQIMRLRSFLEKDLLSLDVFGSSRLLEGPLLKLWPGHALGAQSWLPCADCPFGPDHAHHLHRDKTRKLNVVGLPCLTAVGSLGLRKWDWDRSNFRD